jgi:hypothetical protein
VDLTAKSSYSLLEEMGLKIPIQETSPAGVDRRSKTNYSIRVFEGNRFIEFLAEDD